MVPRAIVLLTAFCGLLLLAPWLGATINEPSRIHIGVLAKEGKKKCFLQWQASAAFIEGQFPEYNVSIVCLAFDEVAQAVEEGRVDFTITNPSIYVELEHRYGVSRLATLKNKRSRQSHSKFGGVIFYRSDRDDIQSVEDLKEKRFMAVSQNSFGGWLVVWRYLRDKGIDPYADFKELLFGERHDTVVRAVENGDIDAGAIRTDTLERLAWEGKIRLNDFDILDQQTDALQFPFLRTTRLYPEWPFAKAAHTKELLAKRIALVLLQMEPESRAAIASRSRGWTIPLDYQEVHDCLRELKVGPYKDLGIITLGNLYSQYKAWMYIGFIFLFATFCGITIVLALNRRLVTAMSERDCEHQQRALVIADLNEFKITLDQTLDCVFMFSNDSLGCIYVNQGGRDQVGYSLEELLGMTLMDITPDFTEPEFRAMLAPLITDPYASLTFTTNHRRKDGTLVPVEVFLQHITPPDKMGRFVAIVRDITIRLEKEREQEQLQAKLLNEQKLASVGQLAAGIAHEVNTPIQYIGANLTFLDEAFEDIRQLMPHYDRLIKAGRAQQFPREILSEAQEAKEEIDWPYLEEEIPQSINQSQDGIQQVSSIVLAMKHFSHPGSTEKEMADLNELIKTTLTVARNEWKHFADIRLQLEERLPPVHCMRNEMGQVFLNLIVNAAHAIEKKLETEVQETRGEITISTSQADAWVHVMVMDTGCGISEADMEKVFDPFFTTKEVGKGTGQGLTIAFDIVTNKHDGRLSAESEEGEGTTIKIELPCDGAEKNHDENS